MTLRDEFERTGQWLFRWRSYLPFVMVALVLLSLRRYESPHQDPVSDRWWEAGCVLVSFIGVVIRWLTTGCAAKGTSGRNTGGQIANALNTTGLYSLVRHPLYLGNFFLGLGVSLLLRLWWFSFLYALLFWIYYERIMFAEEEFLRRTFGQAYLDWADRTPALVPRWRNWQPPSVPFSIRRILKRETSTGFGVITAFAALDTLSEIATQRRFAYDPMWVGIFSVSLVLYLILRTLSKRTTLLDVTGR